MSLNMSLEEIRNHLTGPITSLRTPFNRDGSVVLPWFCARFP